MQDKKQLLSELRKAIASVDTSQDARPEKHDRESSQSAAPEEQSSGAVDDERHPAAKANDELKPSRTEDQQVRQRAKDKAFELLARRPHTAKELRDKLAARDFPESIVEATIERVAELGYIDEADIARQRASQIARKGNGPRKIREKLRRLGIAHGDIEAAIELANDELAWVERAEEWARRRGLDRKLTSKAEKQKAYQKLLRRGFDSSIVRIVVFDRLAE